MKKNEPHPIWRFLSSLKLTIVLLILLAGVCVLGTLIPQQQGAVEFARSLSPAMLRLFSRLNLLDMYHAPWFRFLIGFLALNLMVCSLNRFPATWKRFKATPSPNRKKPFEGISSDQTLLSGQGAQETAPRLEKIIRSGYRHMRKKSDAASHYYYMEKGRYSYFGVYLVHLSVLLFILGGLIGSFFGFEAHVNIVEGETVDRVILTKQKKPLPLDFQVRCDDFSVAFYETGAPKEFKSTLTFLKDGKKVRQSNLLVNHPVTFDGITFYQATYGTVPAQELQLKIVKASKPPVAVEMTVSAAKSYRLLKGNATFKVLDTRTDIMGLGPAALISVEGANKKAVDFWVFKNVQAVRKKLPPPMLKSPKFNPSAFKPYTFFLAGLQTRHYTGLQANRDPGVSVIWAGCFLMIAGLFVSFFLSHKRIWVRVLKNKDETATIQVAGTTNKNPVGLQTEIRQLLEKIQKEFGTKG